MNKSSEVKRHIISRMIRIGIVADDLSGAADTALQFVQRFVQP